MNGKRGFTLIELLVVIAIITILAGIVVPRVMAHIARARGARAQAEINGITTSLTSMLADSGRSNFGQFISHAGRMALDQDGTLDRLGTAQELYRNLFYALLKKGRNVTSGDYRYHADILDPAVVRKLGTTYMDLGTDPWGQLYQFWMGPWNTNKVAATITDTATLPKAIYFRIYKVEDIPGNPVEDDYTIIESQDEDAIPELPFGFPAPKDVPVYVYSTGADLLAAQAFYQGDGKHKDAYNQALQEKNMGGGDDINNWDTGASWAPFYR